MLENDGGASISVVMVTLNEEDAVESVVSEIKESVPEAEVVIVDSSTDGTAQLAEQLGCNVITQLPPQGYGPALHAALQAAHGAIVVTMDCDGTYPAKAIPILVATIENGYDVVGASRLQKRPRAMPLLNYLANRFFAWLAGWLCGVKSTDLHTGMRAYRKSIIQSISYDPHGMALPVELLVAAAQKGYRCTEVFIDYRPRIGRTTLRPLEGTFWTLRRLWRRRRFLRW